MSDELFNKCVSLIRRGDSFTDILREIEALGPAGVDAMAVYSSASAYAKETQEAAYDCSIEAFRQGATFQDVVSKLEQCGFHNWDASIVAGRAKHAADAEAHETASEVK